MIRFHEPIKKPYLETYLAKALASKARKDSGGFYSKACVQWLENHFKGSKVLLTTSATAALELAAALLDIGPGDEVILPSFTYVATATPFASRGARLIFVDIDPVTMNLDVGRVEQAISPATKAIVPVHYAGQAVEMASLLDLARRYELPVIEDAAQALGSYYGHQPLGSLGRFGVISFHDTKNYSMGEGGALIINDEAYVKKALIHHEKGTNKAAFLAGQVAAYTWQDLGSSYGPSDLLAAYLYPQLLDYEDLLRQRLDQWSYYQEKLLDLEHNGHLERPSPHQLARHNGHIFFIKCKDQHDRVALQAFLRQEGIEATIHYLPLHLAPAGKAHGGFCGQDLYTSKESQRLLRLPLHYQLTKKDQDVVLHAIRRFYKAP